MKKPATYDTATPIKTLNQSLPAGVYKVVVVGALDTYSKNNNPMLALSLDIVGGAYEGYFTKMYEKAKEADAQAKYPCIYNQVYDGSDFAVGRIKGLVELFSECNPQFAFDWNTMDAEHAFIGCVMGATFREEEFVYRKGERQGQVGTIVRVNNLIHLNEIDTTPTPTKKTLDQSQSYQAQGGYIPYDDDVPF